LYGKVNFLQSFFFIAVSLCGRGRKPAVRNRGLLFEERKKSVFDKQPLPFTKDQRPITDFRDFCRFNLHFHFFVPIIPPLKMIPYGEVA
jgi:hypothetical protein